MFGNKGGFEVNIICKMIFGSHLYQLNSSESDTDYKSVYLPTKRQLILNQYKKVMQYHSSDDCTKNSNQDVDEDIIALPEFIRQAVKGETYIIDMLHCNDKCLISTSIIWQDLIENRKKFYTKNMKAFLGYARRQASKYGIKGSRMGALESVYNIVKDYNYNYSADDRLESIWKKLSVNDYCYFKSVENELSGTQNFYSVLDSCYQDKMSLHLFVKSIIDKWNSYGERARKAKDNEGIDWKAVSHALRASYQLRSIYKNGDFEYPLDETSIILEVKKGKLDFMSFVQPELEKVISEVEELSVASNFPDKCNKDFWDDWLVEVYEEFVL